MTRFPNPHDERRLTIQARLMWSDDSPHPGEGTGRWRTYYHAEGLDEVAWWVRDLVPSCQMRVLHGREVIVPPIRVSDYREAWALRQERAGRDPARATRTEVFHA